MKFNKKILLLNKSSVVSVNVWSVCIFCYIYLTSFSCRKKLQRVCYKQKTTTAQKNRVAHVIKLLRVFLQYQKSHMKLIIRPFFG